MCVRAFVPVFCPNESFSSKRDVKWVVCVRAFVPFFLASIRGPLLTDSQKDVLKDRLIVLEAIGYDLSRR